VAGKVLGGVLPFAVRVVRRRAEDPSSALPGAFMMATDVFDAD
jgi:hypothetical protein